MSDYLMCGGYEAALLQMGQAAEEDHKVVTHYCGLLKEKRTHTNTPTHQLPLYFSVTFSYELTQIHHNHLSGTFSFSLLTVLSF